MKDYTYIRPMLFLKYFYFEILEVLLEYIYLIY